jgi:Outer membrane protein beta-barrel domain
MKKLSLILLFSISSFSIILGQSTTPKVHFGFRAGAGLGKVATEKFMSNVTNFDPQRLKYVTCFGVAIVSEVNIKNNFAIQAELGYALRGSVGEDTFGSSVASIVSRDVTGTYNIIELPVLAKFKFNGLYLTAGPQLQYIISGNKIKNLATPSGFSSTDGDYIISDISAVKFGLGGGIGYQSGKVFVETRANWVPSKTYPGSLYGSSSLAADSNISFGLNLGYFFK